MITTVEGRATRSVTNDKNIPWRCQERKCHRLISGRHPVPAFHFLTLFLFFGGSSCIYEEFCDVKTSQELHENLKL